MTSVEVLPSIGRRTLCVAAMGLALPEHLLAGDRDAALYDPDPPPGSAFVRLLNATAASLSVTIGTLPPQAIASGSLSPYFAVLAAGLRLGIAGRPTNTVRANPGAFLTMVAGQTSLQRFEDPPEPGPLRAHLLFYNLTPDPLGLRLADTKTPIFQPTASGRHADRTVASTRTRVELTSGDRVLAIAPLQTTRGRATSIVAMPGHPTPRVLVQDATLKVQA